MVTEEMQASKGGRTMWIWVILAFIVLGTAWAGLIVIASKNQPEVIEIQKP